MTDAVFEQCIQKICAGDQQGLKEIYEEYLPYLYRIVYGIVQNREDAEDITSDFFVKLWSLAPKYRAGNGHKGYLATIARNMALDHVRKNRRLVPLEDPGGGLDASDSPGAREKACESRSLSAPEDQVISDISLQEALDRLKPAERQIITMKVLGEMTFAEISKLLHVPMGTVTWRYQEGMKRLRRYGYE